MLDYSQIDLYLDSISERGFVEILEALPLKVIDDVNQLIGRPLNRPTINGRRGYVQAGNMRFLYQTLSWGREVIDIYTHPVIIELASRHAQDAVHLSNFTGSIEPFHLPVQQWLGTSTTSSIPMTMTIKRA